MTPQSLRILALTFGDADTASTRFRLVQYRRHMAAAGINCEMVPAKSFCDFGALGSYDVVILQKTLLNTSTVKKLRRGAKRFIYDVDDLIWLAPGKKHSIFTRFRTGRRLRTIARSCDLCLAPNRVIAHHLQEAGGRTAIVPMALDGDLWHPSSARDSEPLTIGWSGAPKNLSFLREILPALREVQLRFPEVRWVVHSGENPGFDAFRYNHVPFVSGNEPQTVGSFHIGLLPLPDDPFVRGKSPIKALQYFACGVAVVGNPVGATREILTNGADSLWADNNDSWVAALSRLIQDDAFRTALGRRARKTFDERHALPVVFDRLRAALFGETDCERNN